MIMKILSIFIIACSFTMGTSASANDTVMHDLNVSTQKFLRFTDTKDEYGRSCEVYSYISSEERFRLLKQHNFMFGDILSDTLSIPNIDPDHVVETNLTECNNQNMYVSEYSYREKLDYFNENIITIEVFQYQYGAGAAHGNGHISYYVYDREYGMKIDWQKLFGKSEVLDLYVLKRVVKEIADEDFISYFKASKQLLNFREEGYFSINDEGLLIQYGKYEITPGSSGLPSIVVPKEVLKQYMTKEMYEKCFSPKSLMIAEAMYDQ